MKSWIKSVKMVMLIVTKPHSNAATPQYTSAGIEIPPQALKTIYEPLKMN